MTQRERASALIKSLSETKTASLAREIMKVVEESQNEARFGGAADGSLDVRQWNALNALAGSMRTTADCLHRAKLALQLPNATAATPKEKR